MTLQIYSIPQRNPTILEILEYWSKVNVINCYILQLLYSQVESQHNREVAYKCNIS